MIKRIRENVGYSNLCYTYHDNVHAFGIEEKSIFCRTGLDLSYPHYFKNYRLRLSLTVIDS